MNTHITRILKEQKETFLNLYNLYLYDLSEFTGEDITEEGTFDPTNTYLYLEKKELHPYFISYEGKIIGFILVCSPPYVPEGIDYAIQELFIIKKYRGMKLAAEAVHWVLEQFQGKFKVEQLSGNQAAVRFWKKYYEVNGIHYSEEEDSIEIEGISGSHKVISQTFTIQGG
ncbi:GNAT family N-acetyltransferase [Paenibacillus sp. Marseille-Q4541]|uniref:GNAT family N-acetyltransferase n=1 Tax=Paenibacillus sp. Marseille-Q4541 TaxID=2831522 RepID=UPI001BA58C73|nr:GNAT family N-acetyltransferase [Paenibacillus sp. Marseille-Q4541]